MMLVSVFYSANISLNVSSECFREVMNASACASSENATINSFSVYLNGNLILNETLNDSSYCTSFQVNCSKCMENIVSVEVIDSDNLTSQNYTVFESYYCKGFVYRRYPNMVFGINEVFKQEGVGFYFVLGLVPLVFLLSPLPVIKRFSFSLFIGFIVSLFFFFFGIVEGSYVILFMLLMLTSVFLEKLIGE